MEVVLNDGWNEIQNDEAIEVGGGYWKIVGAIVVTAIVTGVVANDLHNCYENGYNEVISSVQPKENAK